MKPRALILLAPGTNRHLDVARAFELAGATSCVVPWSHLQRGQARLSEYQILVVPGGFSYADCLGSGVRLAQELSQLQTELREFVAAGKPVLGICNGFQTLVQAGLLPGNRPATLAPNRQGEFVCRWVSLQPASRRCLWTRELQQPIHCPVAHGEGNFQLSPSDLEALEAGDQVALRYAPLAGALNPSGSLGDIAGVTNPEGNVLGLMPHPENHILDFQYPFGDGRCHSGLRLFEQGVRYAHQLG